MPNGTYSVSLHFAENWTGGQGVGLRVFDVLLEGALVIDNFDIFSEAGGYRADQDLPVTVTDGQLNIGFAHGAADDPTIGAIEILGTSGGGGGGDTQPPTVPQNLTAQATSGTQVNLSWAASTDNGGGVVSGYRIYRDGVAIATSHDDLLREHLVVTVGTQYSLSGSRVRQRHAGERIRAIASCDVTTPACQRHGNSSEYRRAAIHRYTGSGVGSRLWL